jgi:glycerophosphoryl diester phosphodiesterase
MKTTISPVAVAGLLTCASCSSLPPMSLRRSVLVVAHRGDSMVAPENTLSAFRSAVREGAHYVELDARLSADGTLYVLHDETLDRTTNAKDILKKEKIRLRQTPDAVVNRLDAGSWSDPRYTGERLPTLAEALDVIQSRSYTLLERKDGSAEAYLRLLRDKHLVGRLVVQSFDWEFLEQMHNLEPRQPLGALGEKEITEQKLAGLASTGAAVVAWQHDQLTAASIADLHGRGYKVWAWTPDEPADWDRLVSAGIDGIITNRPGQLIQHLQQQAGTVRCRSGL